MTSLDRIAIRGLKSIRDADLTLRSLNVLIGANGAGKSNLVSVFDLIRHIEAQRLQVYVAQAGGADSLLYYGRRTTERIELSLSFGQNGYKCVLVPTTRDTLVFSGEECWFHDTSRYDRPYTDSLGSGHEETRLHEVSRSTPRRVIADYVLKAMRSWRVYHFHDTSESAKVKATSDIGDNAALRDDAANLAAYLYMLRENHRDAYNRIISTIRMVAPFFDDFVLRPMPLNPSKTRLEWQERASDAYFSAHSLSDGTLRFICLATLLLMPDAPDTILVDEPELGLHPYAISVLAGMLRSAASRTQVIVSTQSATLVNQFAPEDVVVVDRVDGESQFQRLDESALGAWLTEDYGLGDLWEKNLLGGRPR